ncbi:hypothetical protein DXG01_002924, partial [Tephrocybe rancida]
IDGTSRHYIELDVVDNGLDNLIDDVVGSRNGGANGQSFFVEPPVKSSASPTSDKRPAKRQKVNPFLDIEAEEDTREDADILDDTEGESEFDDFIDDCELAPDEEPPTAHSLIDEAEKDAQRDGEVPGEEDEDLDDEEYSDNEYPPTAAAISHKALVSHGNMEQWQSLLARAYEQAREHQAPYGWPSPGGFDDGLEPLPPALLYRVRVKEGYEETAAMVLGNKLLTVGTHFAPSVKSIIGRISCPGWVFIESNRADASKLFVNDLQQYLHEPLVVPKEGDWVRLTSPPLYHGETFHLSQLSNLNNEKRKPLVYKYYADMFQSDMPPPAQPVLIP